MDLLLRRLMESDPEPAPVAQIADWWPIHERAAAGLALPLERAVAAGFAADRLGYAFASGYREALRHLVPQYGGLMALCATEGGSAHPSALRTALWKSPGEDGWILDGRKSWVTLGAQAERLLVVASEGQDPQGRNRLAVVSVTADREGILWEPLPPAPFAPEVPHAAVELRGVRVAAEERLPGDGYAQYLKPFRTVEDCHVHGAFLGWFLQNARRWKWQRGVQQELLQLVCALWALAGAVPDDAAVHVALGGLLARVQQVIGEYESLWEQAGAAERARWERDRPLLQVAGKVRAQRLAKAWERLV